VVKRWEDQKMEGGGGILGRKKKRKIWGEEEVFIGV
jgi:hypothetical protein